MEVFHFISELTTIHSAITLWIVGMVAIWFRPVTWHERVAAWKDIHTLGDRVAAASYEAPDPLEWGDPDRYLPFPMEEE